MASVLVRWFLLLAACCCVASSCESPGALLADRCVGDGDECDFHQAAFQSKPFCIMEQQQDVFTAFSQPCVFASDYESGIGTWSEFGIGTQCETCKRGLEPRMEAVDDAMWIGTTSVPVYFQCGMSPTRGSIPDDLQCSGVNRSSWLCSDVYSYSTCISTVPSVMNSDKSPVSECSVFPSWQVIPTNFSDFLDGGACETQPFDSCWLDVQWFICVELGILFFSTHVVFGSLQLWRLGRAWMKSGRMKQRVHVIQRLKRCHRVVGCAKCARRTTARSLFCLVLLVSQGTVQSMDSQQFGALMEAVNTMVQNSAATSQAAAHAIAKASAISSSSSSAGMNAAGQSNPVRTFESASRILKNPETFDSGNPGEYASWRHTFMNWLSFADRKIVDLIRDVEQLDPGTEIETVDWDADEHAMADRLYTILTSYLKGPALQASRNLEKERNGFKLWQQLSNQFAPSTRQRSLALSQAVSSFPVFGEKSLTECIANLESLVHEYESTAGKPFDRDILLGVLLRCSPAMLRQHLTLNLNAQTTYESAREQLLAYERSSKTWDSSELLKQAQLPSGTPTKPADPGTGPAAMDVDAVAFSKGKKGKGKQKGSGKFNGFAWQQGWSAWRKGKGKSSGKSKGKHKGKSKGKGKNKGKGNQKGKNNQRRDSCRICGQPGHWGNECPNRQHVQEVNATQGPPASTPAATPATSYRSPSGPPSTASTAASSVYPNPGARGIRRVHMYHLATPPDELEEFDLASESNSVLSYKTSSDFRAWAVFQTDTCEEYFIGDAEIPGECNDDAQDGFYAWMSDDAPVDVSANFPLLGARSTDPTKWPKMPCFSQFREELPGLPGVLVGGLTLKGNLPDVGVSEEFNSVCVASETRSDASEWIVLDSGADVSLFPKRLAYVGQQRNTPASIRLEDAQGGEIAVSGMNQAQILFSEAELIEPCSDSPVCSLSEDFIVSDVKHILLSLGRLLKHHWRFSTDGCDGHFAGTLHSPDGLYRIPVHYRKNNLAIHGSVRCAMQATQPSVDVAHVHAVAVSLKFNPGMLDVGWQFGADATPLHKYTGRQYVDSTTVFSLPPWRYRTTLAKIGSHWELVALSEELIEGADHSDDIPGIVLSTTILTLLHRRYYSMDELTSFFEASGADSGLPGNEGGDIFRREEAVPELHGPDSLTAVAGPLQPLPHEHAAGGLVGVPEQVTVNDKEISLASSSADLKNACEFLGLSQGGSKARLYNRICQYLKSRREQEIDHAATQLQKESDGPRVRIQSDVAAPSEQEMLLHMATHLPYKPWCDICVKTKGKDDPSPQVADLHVEDRGKPFIQMDWMYVTGQNTPALAMLDSWTRYGRVFPARTKGAYRHVAEAAVRFSLELNYLDEVTFVMDQEPATIALLDLVVDIRQKMGYKTNKLFGKPHHKGRTAKVERFIQTVRRQSAALVQQIEVNINDTIPETHVLRAWSVIHASFLLNRFHEHSALKATPFELVTGQAYRGKILPFGEFVFGLRKPVKNKGNSLWLGGVWVGKDSADMNIIVSERGQFQSRSVRRCGQPWRKEVSLSLATSPWTSKVIKQTGFLEAPLPVIAEGPGDEAASDPPTEEEQSATQMPGAELAIGQQMDAPVTGSHAMSELDSEIESPSPVNEETADRKRQASEGVDELRAQTEEQVLSPSSQQPRLFPPLFAGNVESMPTDDERWEDDMWDIEEPMIETDFNAPEKPPDVTADELAALDSDALQAELEKLRRLGVIEDVPEEQCNMESKFVDLTTVFDWRFREESWRRRCRIVAREFRQHSGTSVSTFSPTSAGSVIRLVLVFHLLFHWKLYALDIRDAFLTVDQQEPMYVKPRSGMTAPGIYWRLKKVLPGQQNGALRWFESFSSYLVGIGFIACAGVPSLMRHSTRPLIINIHVDDELVAAGNVAEAQWLLDQLAKKYKMEAEGPCPVNKTGQGEQLSYLKKVYIFTAAGIVVKPNEKYYENLANVYPLGSKKAKKVPEHERLVKVDFTEELDAEGQARFRSGLGTAMYLSLDRLDIQFCVKCLASYMKAPTVQAEVCLKQLISYVCGTASVGILLPYTQAGKRLIHSLNGADDDVATGFHCMEAFCDSDWGGNATRKSTTSVIILLDGVIIHSYSRNQKSIALSSCEAEVLAATSAGSEALLLQACWCFLCKPGCVLELRSDSSSARQWLQRTGVGRLKHFSIRLLWLQSAIRENRISIHPVGTKLNVSDLNTKKLSVARRRFLQYYLGMVELNTQNEIAEHVGWDEVHKSLMDEQMKLAVKRVSKCVYHTGGNVERVLMMAVLSQLALGAEAVSTNLSSVTTFPFSGMGEVIIALLMVFFSGVRKGMFAPSMVCVAMFLMGQVNGDSMEFSCSTGGTMVQSDAAWVQYLQPFFMLGCIFTLVWIVREIRASQEQLVLNAHNLRQQNEVLAQHDEALTRYTQTLQRLDDTVEKCTEELTMCANLLANFPSTGSAAATSERPPDPGDVVTVNPRSEVLNAYENLMRRRDVSMMNSDYEFVDALNQNLEGIADSLSIHSDEMDTGEGCTYGAPSLQVEARSMGILHQELVNQLETANDQSNWEAAEMYRGRISQLEDLMLFLPDPFPVSSEPGTGSNL